MSVEQIVKGIGNAGRIACIDGTSHLVHTLRVELGFGFNQLRILKAADRRGQFDLVDEGVVHVQVMKYVA